LVIQINTNRPESIPDIAAESLLEESVASWLNSYDAMGFRILGYSLDPGLLPEFEDIVEKAIATLRIMP
jgi:hypothetical protein